MLVSFTEILPSTASGPLSKIKLVCTESGFYNTMLMINGSYWKNEECANWIEFVPMLMQIYLVAPVLTYIGYRSKKAGMALS